MKARTRRGFTLIELLVVIVIILLLMALILPAIINALCQARKGAAKSLVEQLKVSAKMYETDWAVYPPGDGSGSKEFASFLEKEGAKKQPYFDFNQDQLAAGGDIINPVWPVATGEEGKVYFRNNLQQGGGAGGGGGGSAAPVMDKYGVDIWAADCTFDAGDQNSRWGVNTWE